MNNNNTYIPGQAAVLNRVRNLTSSVAGAGSNEVHMFRQRKEMEEIRLKKMDRELDARTDKVLFEEKRAENVMRDEKKTEKNRNRRKRRKEAKRTAKHKEKAQKRANNDNNTDDEGSASSSSSLMPKEKKQKVE